MIPRERRYGNTNGVFNIPTMKLITVEQMEAATERLLETGRQVGADSWQQRVKNQTPHCKFGEEGICCRICSMGPCRITPKAPRGICGCDVHGIVARNYLRFTAGGSATHSDHGREICHTLYQTREGGNYTVKDPAKLKRIAGEWGVETEGKDIYDLAHEIAEMALMEYGKPFGTQRWLSRAPEHTRKLWHDAGIEPRAIDREVSQSLHMTHMGCSSLPEALIRQSLRAGLSDGWGGSMCGTEFSDVLFGTPKPVDTTANLGVMEKDMVNIVVHGHDPSLSEMIVFYAQDPEMIALAKEQGAKGINICGVCCTANEVAMRHGIPMAGNFLQQENVVLTGACEAIVVDVQCIFPALGPLSKCFHTKFITTSPIARMPDSDFIEFHAENAGENAKAIVKLAVENFKNRNQDLVHIPDLKQDATVGYSVEAIKKCLDGVTNTQVDVTGTTKPLVAPGHRPHRADEEAHRQRHHRRGLRLLRPGRRQGRPAEQGGQGALRRRPEAGLRAGGHSPHPPHGLLRGHLPYDDPGQRHRQGLRLEHLPDPPGGLRPRVDEREGRVHRQLRGGHRYRHLPGRGPLHQGLHRGHRAAPGRARHQGLGRGQVHRGAGHRQAGR